MEGNAKIEKNSNIANKIRNLLITAGLTTLVMIIGLGVIFNYQNKRLIIKKPGKYTIDEKYKNVIVNSEDVKVIGGNLETISTSKKVGNGTVHLQDTSATTLEIYGGGPNSVYVEGYSNIGNAKIGRKDGPVHISVSNKSQVKLIEVEKGKEEVILSGKINNVKVAANDISVIVDHANVENIMMQSKNSSILINKKSTLDTFTMESGSLENKIVLNGEVKNLNIKENCKASEIEVNNKVGNIVLNSASQIQAKSAIENIIVTEKAKNTTINTQDGAKITNISAETDIKINGKSNVENVVTKTETEKPIIQDKAVTVVRVDNVTLNNIAYTMTEGDYMQLLATVKPDNANNKNLTWESSDNKTLTVSNVGLVTAVKEGTAKVTVKTADNNKVATCTITVNKKIIDVQNILVNESIINLNMNGTKKIGTTVNPSNATNKNLTYTSTNTDVATVSSDGIITAVFGGEAEIIIRSNNGKEAYVLVKVSMTDKEVLDKISLPSVTQNDLKLPQLIGGRTVTWSSSKIYVISNDGELGFDDFWYGTNSNPVTMTAKVGETTKQFIVKAEFPTLVRYELENVGYQKIKIGNSTKYDQLILIAKVAGYDASGVKYYFDFNELKNTEVVVSHSKPDGFQPDFGYEKKMFDNAILDERSYYQIFHRGFIETYDKIDTTVSVTIKQNGVEVLNTSTTFKLNFMDDEEIKFYDFKK